MCCCGQPTINGQLGYRWQPNDEPRVRPVDPPTIEEGDDLVFDEPGRCGGCDAHSHHYRIVRKRGLVYLLVRHGGGDERIKLHSVRLLETLAKLDTSERYWLLHALYYANRDGKDQAADKCNADWRRAAAEKRIKTRKNTRAGTVKVWVE